MNFACEIHPLSRVSLREPVPRSNGTCHGRSERVATREVCGVGNPLA